jgi:MazG family protein
VSKQLTKLLRIMARLRSPTGCSWDREQSHESLIPCLKNESEEVISAIKKKDIHELREELGDLLLQVVFHSQLAREKGQFNFDDVVRMLNRKLIRRHPHVFGKTKAHNTAAVLEQWDKIKAREKKDRRHVRNRKR